MPSWNANYKIFNDSTIVGSVARREYARKRLVARASEARRQFTVKRYWQLEMSGLMINDEQLDEIRAFEAATRQGMEPCLIRIASYCTLEDSNGVASFLGTGNGTEKTFQVKKRTMYQGTPYEDPIFHLWHEYPNLKDLNGEDWKPLDPFRIWLEGADVTAQCDVNRDTGQITQDLTGALYVTGGYLWKMICPGGIGVRPSGTLFEVEDGVSFVEPFPDGGEVADA